MPGESRQQRSVSKLHHQEPQHAGDQSLLAATHNIRKTRINYAKKLSSDDTLVMPLWLVLSRHAHRFPCCESFGLTVPASVHVAFPTLHPSR
jgi:hypothetical protein